MPFEGDGVDVPMLLTAACVGDRRRVAALVLWTRVSKSYRRAAARALQEWCEHEYADAQRAYVDAVLAIGASPAPSPLAMPRAHARLVALCGEAFGDKRVAVFGATLLLCGKMDAEAYMCAQRGTCRLCGEPMVGENADRDPASERSVETAFRKCIAKRSFSMAKTSAALSFTFAHARCQMRHCRPFWTSAERGQPMQHERTPPQDVQADSVWWLGLPTLLGPPSTTPEVQMVQVARKAFEQVKHNSATHLPRSMRPAATVATVERRHLAANAHDERRYANATPRMQAVLRTDFLGNVHSQAKVLQLQDLQDGHGDDTTAFRTRASPRRLHMAWVLPHPAVPADDTLVGSFAGDAAVYADLQACLQARLQRAEASVDKWERQIRRNDGYLKTISAELEKLPGVPSDAIEFLESVHPGTLLALGVVRFCTLQGERSPVPTPVLDDLRWLFVPNEWEEHVALEGDRAPFVASHAEKVRMLLKRARVVALETLHGRDALHPRFRVRLQHDPVAWQGALWVMGATDPRKRGVLARQFLSGLSFGLARLATPTSMRQRQLQRQATRVALDWLFDCRNGISTLVESADESADEYRDIDDRTTVACVLGRLLASLHHTCCQVLVGQVFRCETTHELKARLDFEIAPRLCRSSTRRIPLRAAGDRQRVRFELSVSELEAELAFVLSESVGRSAPKWRELEGAAAALLARPPEGGPERELADVAHCVQRVIDALLRAGLEDGAPQLVRRSALRITRVGSELLRGELLRSETFVRGLWDEQQQICAHYPNVCFCHPAWSDCAFRRCA